MLFYLQLNLPDMIEFQGKFPYSIFTLYLWEKKYIEKSKSIVKAITNYRINTRKPFINWRQKVV